MNMFKGTTAKTPEEYIAMVPDDRRELIQKLHTVITKAVPNLKPQITYGMIGYGNYHYKSKSGREGDWSMVLLANQKNYVSVYVCAVENDKYIAESNKDRLGNVSVGKSCIRFKKPEDINLDVLIELCKKAEELGGLGQFGM